MACCIMVILPAYRICIKTASKHGLNTILLKTLAKVASVMFLYSLTKLFNGCISFYSLSNSALSKNVTSFIRISFNWFNGYTMFDYCLP